MNKTRLVKGAVAGAIGGLAGTYAMNQFQRSWSRINARDSQELAEGQNSGEIAAQTATTAVHFAFGAAMGGLYGAFYEISPATRKMGGAAFGSAVWAAADELAWPTLGLSGPTTEHPPERHAHAFAAQIVFGVTTEIVRRGVRAVLGGGRPGRPA